MRSGKLNASVLRMQRRNQNRAGGVHRAVLDVAHVCQHRNLLCTVCLRADHRILKKERLTGIDVSVTLVCIVRRPVLHRLQPPLVVTGAVQWWQGRSLRSSPESPCLRLIATRHGYRYATRQQRWCFPSLCCITTLVLNYIKKICTIFCNYSLQPS